MRITSRQKQKEHFRVINGKKILVNPGVHHSEKGQQLSGPGDIRSLVHDDHLSSPAAKPPKLTLKERFLGRPVDRAAFKKLGIRKARAHISPVTGKGKVTIWMSHPSPNQASKTVIDVGPGKSVPAVVTTLYRDLSGIDITGGFLDIDVSSSETLLLHNATLDNAAIRGGMYSERILRDVDFTGASLRGAEIGPAQAISNINMSDTDLTDADFSQIKIAPGVGSRQRPDVGAIGIPIGNMDYLRRVVFDFTDSNVTPEQIQQLEQNINPDGSQGPFPVNYRSHTIQEVESAVGIPRDEMRIMIWAGDIEIRDNATHLRVQTGFDSNLHHVPQWEMQRLVRERGDVS